MLVFTRSALSIFIVSYVFISTAYSGGDKMKIDPLILDVRNESEWKTGHLEGAKLIPYDQIGTAISKIVPDKKAKIFLYCRSGRRASTAQEILNSAGYANTVNLGSLENAAKELNQKIMK